jgi:hypothetical protein
VVMIPEGCQMLDIEYRKALSSSGAGQRVKILDDILRFFEEQAVFLIDEGHLMGVKR